MASFCLVYPFQGPISKSSHILGLCGRTSVCALQGTQQPGALGFMDEVLKHTRIISSCSDGSSRVVGGLEGEPASGVDVGSVVAAIASLVRSWW